MDAIARELRTSRSTVSRLLATPGRPASSTSGSGRHSRRRASSRSGLAERFGVVAHVVPVAG
jgi:hypothetical protein